MPFLNNKAKREKPDFLNWINLMQLYTNQYKQSINSNNNIKVYARDYSKTKFWPNMSLLLSKILGNPTNLYASNTQPFNFDQVL